MKHREERALRASRGYRRRRAGRGPRSRRVRARRAGGRGWRCSWTRGAAPCRRRGAPASARANPFVARSARFGEQLLELGRVVEQVTDFLQFDGELCKLLKQPVPVGDADVAPHLGVAGSDAGEVAEPTRGKREELRRVLAPGDLV